MARDTPNSFLDKDGQPSFEGGDILAHSSFSHQSFTGGSDGKESDCNAGDLGSVSRSGRFPGKVNDNLLQYSCLENPTDRGAWQSPWSHKELE